mmetsp:Transcript_14543/g.29449  ORF Transcript_14543/g.29449 Transcript_14543/m.29449 type:complete len:318 (-) Transcript_14543:93-1046(-)
MQAQHALVEPEVERHFCADCGQRGLAGRRRIVRLLCDVPGNFFRGCHCDLENVCRHVAGKCGMEKSKRLIPFFQHSHPCVLRRQVLPRQERCRLARDGLGVLADIGVPAKVAHHDVRVGHTRHPVCAVPVTQCIVRIDVSTAHRLLVVLFVECRPWRAPKLARCGRACAPPRVTEARANEVVPGHHARCRLSHQLDERRFSALAEGGKRRDSREGQVRDMLLKQDRVGSGCVHEPYHELVLLVHVEVLVHNIAMLEGKATQMRCSLQEIQHRAGAALWEPVINHQSRLGLRRRAPDGLHWRASDNCVHQDCRLRVRV